MSTILVSGQLYKTEVGSDTLDCKDAIPKVAN